MSLSTQPFKVSQATSGGILQTAAARQRSQLRSIVSSLVYLTCAHHLCSFFILAIHTVNLAQPTCNQRYWRDCALQWAQLLQSYLWANRTNGPAAKHLANAEVRADGGSASDCSRCRSCGHRYGSFEAHQSLSNNLYQQYCYITCQRGCDLLNAV